MVNQKTEILIREEIIATGVKINQMGLNQGTSGNVSVRWEKGMLITPSGIPYEALVPEDIIYVEFATNHAAGPHQPSSEWLFHRDILMKRDEICAVIHTHSTYATAMAIQRMDIPAHHYMVTATGGKKIRCAQYATFGTQQLSDNALIALGHRRSCLLANHGVISLGADLAQALWLANEVKILAKQYVIASQLGTLIILDDEEMDRVLLAFKSYGAGKS